MFMIFKTWIWFDWIIYSQKVSEFFVGVCVASPGVPFREGIQVDKGLGMTMGDLVGVSPF